MTAFHKALRKNVHILFLYAKMLDRYQNQAYIFYIVIPVSTKNLPEQEDLMNCKMTASFYFAYFFGFGFWAQSNFVMQN